MKRSILKETFATYFKHSFSYFSLSLLYTTFILLGLFISYFFLPLIIPVVLFVFVPFSFSLHVCVNEIRNDEPFSLGMFFKSYALYYNGLFRGGYSSLKNVVFSMLLFFISTLVVFTPFEMVEMYTNPELSKVIMSDVDFSYEELYNLVMNNSNLFKYLGIAVGVAGFIASIFFFYKHLKNSLIISAQLMSEQPQPMMMLKQFSRYQFRVFKKKYYSEFFKFMLIPLIIYLIGFVGGFLIHFFFINQDPTMMLTFAFIVGLFLLVPLYPLIVILLDNIISFHKNSYKIAYAKSVLFHLERMPSLPDEESNAVVKKLLEQAKEIINTTKED